MNMPARHQIVKDATSLQRRAADPQSSVWVMASAGTGKTTVLVERFIRLVLSGTRADKILCLTYTKAAATQMKERILKRVGAWVRMDEDALQIEISDILQGSATAPLLNKARNLMGELLDQLDRLNIMTIHSFCQSLLARFQLEAGLSGGLDIMEDWAANEIFNGILQNLLEEDDSPYIEQLVHIKAESEWHDLLALIVTDRLKFQALFNTETRIGAALNTALHLEEDETEDQALTRAMQDIPRDLLLCMADNFPNDAHFITKALESPQGSMFHTYAQLFLTQKLEPRKIKNLKNDAIQALIPFEQARLQNAYDHMRRIRTRDMTLCLSYLAQQSLKAYSAYKEKSGVLDYQDLIEKTVSLLSVAVAKDWIRYKLDGGIDQVLVDEAQDTNPLQWHIIAKLIEEYFTGLGSHEDINRTLFVVGDTKQSIYSFQGADPDTASAYHAIFKHAAVAAGKSWQDVPLNTSFRTSQDILNIVDACSAWGKTLHNAGKSLPGRVELWPCLEPEKAEKEDEFWRLPSQTNIKIQRQLVEQTADHIKALLDGNIALPSKDNAAIAPQDILVLVQNRNHYPVPLIQALRKRNVKVAGIDSFCLTDDIAVQDILSLLNWAFFPDDDLALAEILKSPLVAWNDEKLGALSIGRSDSLWHTISHQERDIAHWLAQIRHHAKRQKPAFVIQMVLEMHCPAGNSGYRAMQERLGPASLDALEQLLSYARSRDEDEQGVLAFLKHLSTFAPTVKRELESENAQGVRIMTLHGAKGLEAPVVYLIDTLQERAFTQRASNLQWLDHDDTLLPLWAPRKEDMAPELTALKDERARKLQEESYRLLYVGMTRAKDYLIVGGAGKRAEDETDWYGRVHMAMRDSSAREENGALIYGTWQPLPAPKTAHKGEADVIYNAVVTMPAVPAWPEIVYNYDTKENVEQGSQRARSIGRQWHKLLERAIDRTDAEWDAHFIEWLDDLPDIQPAQGRQRLNALRQHPEYGFLFMPGGAAEVSFITRAEIVMRGRIDRVMESRETLWILDYKTRLNSKDAAQSAAYRQQLAGYRDALTPLANGKPVRTLLIELAQGKIIEVEDLI